MSYRIVKFSQAGNPEKPIIVKVATKKGGSKLDLDLLATDGDEVWRGKGKNLTHSTIQICSRSVQFEKGM